MSSASWNMKTFMKGASILTISAIIVKLLGAVYRVPFQNLVGDKGFYIYQQVYPLSEFLSSGRRTVLRWRCQNYLLEVKVVAKQKQ